MRSVTADTSLIGAALRSTSTRSSCGAAAGGAACARLRCEISQTLVGRFVGFICAVQPPEETEDRRHEQEVQRPAEPEQERFENAPVMRRRQPVEEPKADDCAAH